MYIYIYKCIIIYWYMYTYLWNIPCEMSGSFRACVSLLARNALIPNRPSEVGFCWYLELGEVSD